jgi:hypothetical protein
MLVAHTYRSLSDHKRLCEHSSARIAMMTSCPTAGSATPCNPRSVTRPSRALGSRASVLRPRMGPSKSIVTFHRFGQASLGPTTNDSCRAMPPSGSGRAAAIWSRICCLNVVVTTDAVRHRPADSAALDRFRGGSLPAGFGISRLPQHHGRGRQRADISHVRPVWRQ